MGGIDTCDKNRYRFRRRYYRTLAALSGDTSDMGEARAVGQKVYGPNPTQAQIGALAAMSSAQRNTLLSDALSKTPAADLKPGTFESLISEGFDEGVAMNAVTWVDTDRKAQVLAANIPQQYGYDLSDLGDRLKENPKMKIKIFSTLRISIKLI